LTRIKNKFCILIPARLGSSRLYGKPLKKIGKYTLIERVYNNCLASKYQNQVVVVTDSKKIMNFCKRNNMKCLMTGRHDCGSSRISEVASSIKEKWIVEVQGDEPFLNKKILDKWITKCESLINKNYFPDVFLAYVHLNYVEAKNRKYVKLILNKKNEILWASRSIIPSDYKGTRKSQMLRHTGVHLWKKSSLIKFGSLKKSRTELSEDTHSLRMIENNFLIKGIRIENTHAIDIPSDLRKARMMIKNEK
jgi:3-deoxy-manno-octulosonate cytidylyltransferase (CMP-KDO synthetase)